MKPMVIYVKSQDDKNVTLSKDELESIIRDAYYAGYNDANKVLPNTSPYTGKPVPWWQDITFCNAIVGDNDDSIQINKGVHYE